MGDWLKDTASSILNTIKNAYDEGLKPLLPEKVQSFVSTVGHGVKDAVKGVVHAVEAVSHEIKDKLKPIVAPILKVIGKIIPDIGPFKFSLKHKSKKFTFRFGQDKFWVRLVLTDIESKGSVDWGIHEIKDGGKDHNDDRKKAYVKANQISMNIGGPRLQIGTTLHLGTNDTGSWRKHLENSKEIPIVEMTPLGFNVPGLATLGPKFGVAAKFTFGTVEASGEFYFPFNMSIPEDAIIAIDLSGNQDDIVHVESWIPTFEKTGDWALTGRLSTDITARVQFRANFADVELFGWKAAKAEVAIGPYITERFAAIVSTHEGCNEETTPNKLFSLSMTTVAGIDIRPEISFGDGGWKAFEAMWSVSTTCTYHTPPHLSLSFDVITNRYSQPLEKQLYNLCYQFGPENWGDSHIEPNPQITAHGTETYSAKDFPNPEPNPESEDESLCDRPNPKGSRKRTSIECMQAVKTAGKKQEGDLIRLVDQVGL